MYLRMNYLRKTFTAQPCIRFILVAFGVVRVIAGMKWPPAYFAMIVFPSILHEINFVGIELLSGKLPAGAALLVN